MLYIFSPLDFMVCLCDVFVFSLYIFTSHAQNQIAYINERNKTEVTETDFCSLNNGNEMKYPKSRTISLWYSHFFFCKTDQNCWKKYFMLINLYCLLQPNKRKRKHEICAPDCCYLALIMRILLFNTMILEWNIFEICSLSLLSKANKSHL